MSEVAERSVVVERTLAHAPEKVWRALTTPHLLEAWLLPNDFAPEVGRSFTFQAPPMPQWNGRVDGEVMEIEPPRRLVYSWVVGDMRTVVTFTLEPAPGGVRLRMEQAGFREDQEQNLRGATFGWNRFLDSLAAGLDSGSIA